jgi:hypothetical protein
MWERVPSEGGIAVADLPDSKRPQDRDFTIDKWEEFPFKRKEDPYENRSEDRKESEESQYEYEGWEQNAFPKKDVSEKPADSKDEPHPSQSHPPVDAGKK